MKRTCMLCYPLMFYHAGRLMSGRRNGERAFNKRRLHPSTARGWKPIPGRSWSIRTGDRQDGAQSGTRISYGFQLSSRGKGSGPYIWAGEELRLLFTLQGAKTVRSMARIGDAMDTGFDRARESISSIAANGEMGEPVLDEDAHTLWPRLSVDVKGASGHIKGLVGGRFYRKRLLPDLNVREGESSGIPAAVRRHDNRPRSFPMI